MLCYSLLRFAMVFHEAMCLGKAINLLHRIEKSSCMKLAKWLKGVHFKRLQFMSTKETDGHDS